jgi:hypothetical protein
MHTGVTRWERVLCSLDHLGCERTRRHALDGLQSRPVSACLQALPVPPDKDAKHKVFLIVDNLRVHHAKDLQSWLQHRTRRLELFFLPSYSPEIDPVEVANADLKRTLGQQPPASDEQEMVNNIFSHYRSVQR